MELILQDDALVVRLRPLEKLAAFRFGDIRIPRDGVVRAEPSLPPANWKALRIPGTHLPGVIKAGSYLTSEGWEFWYVTYKKPFHLTLSLQDQRWRRLVLSFPTDPDVDRINRWVRDNPAVTGSAAAR